MSRSGAPPAPVAARFVVAAKRIAREPLFHFLLIGVALFSANAYLNRGGVEIGAPKRIVLTLGDLQQLELLFQSQWRRPPTAQEFDALVETRVKQEVLYREALALGLDKDDEIVKRRMAQKMQFLAEDMAAAHEPSDAELRTWFDANVDKFTLPGRVSFRQIYFSPDHRGARARDDALAALKRLAAEPIDSQKVEGDPTMLQEYYGDRSSEQLAKDFGPVFAQALFEVTPGAWSGPIESGFGWHLVYVDSLVRGRAPTFDEVEQEVKTAWLGEQKAQAWQQSYEAIRKKYVVMLPAVPDAPAQ